MNDLKLIYLTDKQTIIDNVSRYGRQSKILEEGGNRPIGQWGRERGKGKAGRKMRKDGVEMKDNKYCMMPSHKTSHTVGALSSLSALWNMTKFCK